jgi:hypothetical protein
MLVLKEEVAIVPLSGKKTQHLVGVVGRFVSGRCGMVAIAEE